MTVRNLPRRGCKLIVITGLDPVIHLGGIR